MTRPLEQPLEQFVCDVADVAAAYAWSDGFFVSEVLARRPEADRDEVERLVAMYGEGPVEAR